MKKFNSDISAPLSTTKKIGLGVVGVAVIAGIGYAIGKRRAKQAQQPQVTVV